MINKRKILFVLNSAQRSGASIYAEKIISFISFNKNKSDIALLCAYGGDLLKNFEEMDISLFDIGFKSKPNTRLKKIFYRFNYYIRFVYILYTYRPEIVYSNTIINNGEVILSKLFGAYTIVHSHEGNEMIRKWRFKMLVSRFFTDKYIAVSNYSANALMKWINRSSVVIHNGIDVVAPTAENWTVDKIKTIGIIGAITPNKGHLVLLKALDILINVHRLDISIKIVGEIYDYTYYKYLKKYCAEHHLESNVFFSGPLAGITSIYDGIDCVVSASYDEAFPLISLESMALGILLVSSNTGGNKELIKDSVTGLLFPVGDHVALSEKIFWAYSNTQIAQDITVNAMNEVLENYNLQQKLELISRQIADV